jgi:hypothetical protein
MQFYSCYLLDCRYQIAAIELMRCERDVDARQRADALLVQRPAFHGVEVWERERRVHINLVGVEAADEPGDLANSRLLTS